MIQVKKCSEIRALSEFKLRKDTGKYLGFCHDCDRAYFSVKHAQNRDKKNAWFKQWYKGHKEVQRTKRRRELLWAKDNLEKGSKISYNRGD